MTNKSEIVNHYHSWYEKGPKNLTEVISCFPAIKFAIEADDELDAVKNLPTSPFDTYELEIHAVCPDFQEKGELFIRFIRAEKDFSSPFKLVDKCSNPEDLKSDFKQLSEDMRKAYKTQEPLKLISDLHRYCNSDYFKRSNEDRT